MSTAAMSYDAVFAELVAAVRELTGGDVPVGPTTSFQDDLDIDSLQLIELVMIFEERTGLTLEDTELRGIVTIHDAVEKLMSLLREG